MKSNKEKALNHIDKFTVTCGNVPTVHPYIAKEAVELASKPTWFNPSKNELPKINGWINTSEGFPMFTKVGWDYCECQTTGKKYKFSELTAWSYLPIFEEYLLNFI